MYHDLVNDITSHRTWLPEFNIEKKDVIPNTVLIHPGVSLMSVKKGITKTVSAETSGFCRWSHAAGRQWAGPQS